MKLATDYAGQMVIVLRNHMVRRQLILECYVAVWVGAFSALAEPENYVNMSYLSTTHYKWQYSDINHTDVRVTQHECDTILTTCKLWKLVFVLAVSLVWTLNNCINGNSL